MSLHLSGGTFRTNPFEREQPSRYTAYVTATPTATIAFMATPTDIASNATLTNGIGV